MSAVAQSRWSTVAACRDLGKSRLAAYLALWFLTTRKPALVFTVAPTWDQIAEALWTEIRSIWHDSILPGIYPGWEVLTTQIKTSPLTPRWRAIGVTSKDVANIEGRHAPHVLVIIDESKGVPDMFFNSVQGMLSNPHSKLLAIGTPGSPQGWFARSFSSERSLWDSHFRVRADQIPRLAAHCEMERKRLGEGNPWYRQQQLAEFAGADEFTVLPIDKVEAAAARTFEEIPDSITRLWPKYAALDPAGRGSDDSVLTYRLGPKVALQEAWNGWDEMRTANYASAKVAQWGARKFIVDEVGVGAGIRSRIRQALADTGIQVIGYNGGRAPKDRERFLNTKTEELFKLRDRFINDQIAIPNDQKLIEQLCSYRTEFTPTGKTKLADDSENSPDRADSLLMAFAADSRGESFRTLNAGWL